MEEKMKELAVELASQEIAKELETASWSHEVQQDEEGNIYYTGQAAVVFKEYCVEYLTLIENFLK